MGKGNGSFYIGLDYNPTFNGIKDLKIIGETDEDEMDVLTGARGLFPMNALASNVTDFNSYHFDWSTPLPGLEFGNSTLALGGSIGYRIGGARVEVGIGHERFVIKGGDDTAFLLGRELALDTARGQLLSSALGRMSMGDVRRLKKEVVGSIGRGTASPVRAMFSRKISDGDTLLAGEMVGVDEGLVIQELSRPEELEKLQHELAKQVSKLAELGELKWLEQLETLETEELEQGLEGALKALGVEASVQELVQRFKKEIADGKTPEEIKLEWIKEIEAKKLEEVKAKVKGSELAEHLDKTWLLRRIGRVGQELAAIRGLKGEIEDLKGPEARTSLEQLEAKKLEEVEAAKKEVVTKVGFNELGLKEAEWKKLGSTEKLKRVQEVAEKRKLGELKDKLKSKLEELAAIRELRALGLEERLRELAEVKEVRALAEKRKELDVQGGLQLTERIRALGGQLDRLEARRLAESTEGNLEEVWILGNLGQLDELATGKKLRESEATRATLKQLKEIKLVDLERKLETMGELKKEIEKLKKQGDLEQLEAKKIKEVEAALEKVKSRDRGVSNLQEKIKEVKEAGKLKEAKITKLKELVKELEKPGTVSQGELKEGKENLKSKLEELAAIRELKELGLKDWLRLRTLEELTEIAEKRGVATVMKAALTNAMEITKNRGWTDYLNSLDVSERANAARELIAAEKIRKWARDINSLDADERAMVAGALTLFLTPSTTV
ncbi:P44/Msp2 family outer membrane protein [Anaplasma marginale]|uniref:P44/Msp2 family outer membrane protein n=1 Tax=Anaplasma marginale TaxID=770 RepID=UPI001F452F5B|nr:P44/Msp2 family outer membrane protein [Anaplasma marginale]